MAAKPAGKKGAISEPGPTRDETTGAYSLYQEAGATGLKQYSGYVREEWEPQLLGRKGMLVYREMYDNDPIINAIFFAITMLIRGVSFHVEGGDSTGVNQKAADFVESCLGDMEETWASFLAELMPFLLYGWDVHEKVFKRRSGYNPKDKSKNSKYDDGKIGWRKFAIRSQETLLHWTFNEDGDATNLIQLLPTGGPLLSVPLERCLHFRTTPYKANPEGRSLIRGAYTSYFLKKRIQQIEAIGVERDLTGLPVMYVPSRWTLQNATAEDKAAMAACKTLVRDIRNNEQSGVVLPRIWNDKQPTQQDLELTLLATGGRRQFATPDIIQRYNQCIAQVVLADFITLGGGGGSSHGSYAQSKNKTDFFSMTMTALLDIIVGEINDNAIPELLRLNGMKDAQVQLTHGDVARRDLEELGTYLMDIAQAGILTPDATIEAHVREEAGLPPADQTALRDPTGGGDSQTQNQPGAADDGEDDDKPEPKPATGTPANQAGGRGTPANQPGGRGTPANQPKPGAAGAQPPPPPIPYQPMPAPYANKPQQLHRPPVRKRKL